MRIHYLQHVAFEGPAQLATWAQESGHTAHTTRLFAGEKISAGQEDLLVILGGPMSAQDDRRYAWMAEEKKAIQRAIQKGTKVLGVCLGAQLIANVLGARVYANPEKEMGWWPIELNPPNVRRHPLNVLPQRCTVFHWHGETFDLPKDAVHLARSRACENQAFAYGTHVLGLQFHLELSAPHIESLIQKAAHDLAPGAFVQDEREMLESAAQQAPRTSAALARLLDRWTKTTDR